MSLSQSLVWLNLNTAVSLKNKPQLDVASELNDVRATSSGYSEQRMAFYIRSGQLWRIQEPFYHPPPPPPHFITILEWQSWKGPLWIIESLSRDQGGTVEESNSQPLAQQPEM